jgi:two-component system response regulator SaeR
MPERRLLVVDDEVEIADVVKRCGESVGFVVEVATDGVDGFTRAQNGAYDLICMDIRMPLWSGVGSATAIKLLKPQQKILVISGYLDDETTETLEQHVQVVGWIRKPFEVRALIEKLKTLMP